MYITRSYDEIKLIFDCYVQGSLKKKMRKKRTGRDEIQYHIHDTTNLKNIPLKKFLSHIQTKSELTQYLAGKALEHFHKNQKYVSLLCQEQKPEATMLICLKSFKSTAMKRQIL